MFLLKTLSLLVLTALTRGAGLPDYRDESGYSLHDEWSGWRQEHKKEYSDLKEHLERFAIWASNREYINQHNQNAELFGYSLKMNQFGDFTTKEFVELYQCVQSHKGVNASLLNQLHNTNVFIDYHDHVKLNSDAPSEMDWRRMGIVTKVKDQLRCGSSYAFSAMASLEGITALAYGKADQLSEQNIIDCSVAYGNYGCVCGEVNKAFLYVIENDGVDTWYGYPSGGDPYRSRQYSCKYTVAARGATARGIVVLTSGSETRLMNAVGTMGPVSVNVDATSTAFQFYAEGIMNVHGCSSTQLSHAMSIIGYGTSRGKDYWLLKNSFGPHWGISGYIMMTRNMGNQCGIATSASLPAL